MDSPSIKHCLLSLKSTNLEGMDRIPKRILLDGGELLVMPLAKLFNHKYYEKSVPDQWLIAKTTPVFKNIGDVTDIKNNRQIANLCSVLKIFEKLILIRILNIQATSNAYLTGKNQQGLKTNWSTLTLLARI